MIACLLAVGAALAEPLDDLESGFRAHREGKYDQAVEFYSKIIHDRRTKAQDRATTLLLRGEAYKDKGDYDLAIKDFKLALRIKPNYAQACFLMGQAYEKKGDLVEAYRSLKQARSLRPEEKKYTYRLETLKALLAAKGLKPPEN